MDTDYSVPFNRHAWTDSEEMVQLVETIFTSLPAKTQQELVGRSNNKGSMGVKDILRIILADFTAHTKETLSYVLDLLVNILIGQSKIGTTVKVFHVRSSM